MLVEMQISDETFRLLGVKQWVAVELSTLVRVYILDPCFSECHRVVFVVVYMLGEEIIFNSI